MHSGGRADAMAMAIRDTQEAIATERTRRADELEAWRAAEAVRAASVKAEADRVRFE